MRKLLKKIVIFICVLLFSLFPVGCTEKKDYLGEGGLYIADAYDYNNGYAYYAEVSLTRISEAEYNERNGINVFAEHIDRNGLNKFRNIEQRYYLIEAYVIMKKDDEEKKTIYLNFENLQVEKLYRMFDPYIIYVDNNGNIFDPFDRSVSIEYKYNDFEFRATIYQKSVYIS